MSDPPVPRDACRLLQLSVVLIGVYVVLDIVAQLLPPHYNPISQAESNLAVGPYGYVMTVNFVVRGVLSLAFLLGLTRATSMGRRSPLGIGLLGVWAIGAFVLAVSPTDVGSGPVTLHGTVHLLTALVAFVAAAVGEILLSLRFGDDPRLAELRTPALAVSALAFLSMVVLYLVDARPRIASEAFGLIERVFLAFVLLWMLVVALYLLRSDRSATTASSPAQG
ncbi:MAG: DUF998 domain-containing protein [Thermoplasmata archaeon]